MTRRRRALLVAASAVVVAAIVGAIIVRLSPTTSTPDDAASGTPGTSAEASSSGSSRTSASPTASGAPSSDTGAAAQPFDRSARSTTDPRSPWVIINQTHPISPSTYAPRVAVVDAKEVGAAIARPLRRLLRAAEDAGTPLRVISGFRSYGYQRRVHESEVAATGSLAAADAMSARPGFSEHQSGFAVDVDDATYARCQLDACFGRTAAGRWVAAHAGEFGFLVRYTRADRAVTGFQAEPWHLRYVGRPLVRAMQAAGVSTLEEFFGVTGGTYAGR